MSGHVESVSSVTSHKQRIPHKNKIKKFSDTVIKGKEIIQEETTEVKGQKRIFYLMQKKNNEKTPPLFKHKKDSIGDTNEKTCGSYGYPSETDGCARNLGE